MSALLAEAGALAAYRRAVRATLEPATIAGPSPVHPFVLTSPEFARTTRRITGADPSQVHISQEFTVHRLLRDDEKVSSSLEVTGARREARGIRVAMRTEIRDADGGPVCAMVTTVLLTGVTEPEPFGEMPPLAAPAGRNVASTGSPAGTGRAEPVTRTVSLSRADVAGYAEVSGDRNPIHLDDEAARAAGFDSVIAHGMSVVALVTELAVDLFAGGDPARVRGLGCRFSSPVRPGEPVEVSFRPDESGSVVAFTCATPRGIALKGGWITLGDGDA
ncbi:MaoC/PaaZ C-terminal domain-containing protein [Actinoplanes derwentensis]|uniref:Acyl dehydratase n=1 Tax=Actinoplanes derwentensis TaxID=113562 RepID=A0A1H1RC10_9ACTN|nr:MaoC/PaaZ C-terminal domain-containing protein [Actinoplanes derwentensis]GID88052.1 hypothetical protein Ade03nite_69760 [Actinoplanes derwentensis]SDS32459.1 Acyl dehydratase [Actinoplanes derwentensis]